MSNSEADDDAIELSELGLSPTASDWISRLLQIPSFSLIAPLQLQAMFLRMQKVTVEPGEIVLREGEVGDYFYVIATGRCAVSSARSPLLAELQSGDYFGEEALLTQAPRNASVTMLTRGELMRLARSDFLDVLQVPAQRCLSAATARTRIEHGQAQWLDVEARGTAGDSHCPPATQQIPLEQLRARIGELDRQQDWIVCSSNHGRNAVAFFLVSKHGLDSYVLEDQSGASLQSV